MSLFIVPVLLSVAICYLVWSGLPPRAPIVWWKLSGALVAIVLLCNWLASTASIGELGSLFAALFGAGAYLAIVGTLVWRAWAAPRPRQLFAINIVCVLPQRSG